MSLTRNRRKRLHAPTSSAIPNARPFLRPGLYVLKSSRDRGGVQEVRVTGEPFHQDDLWMVEYLDSDGFVHSCALLHFKKHAAPKLTPKS